MVICLTTLSVSLVLTGCQEEKDAEEIESEVTEAPVVEEGQEVEPLIGTVETAPPETAPSETVPPETVPPETVPPETVPPETAPPETAPPETQAAYANCDAVRAAGADPIHRGDPGFSPRLDRDGDGVACE